MAHRKPPRLPLGASALAALAIAGCGASGKPPRASLHAAAEKRLLGMIAVARADASRRDGAAVHDTLSQFVAEVQALRTSGQLSGATARSLTRQAMATGTEASSRLHPTETTTGISDTGTTGQGSTSPGASPTAPQQGAAPTKPAKQPAPGPGDAVPPGHQDGHGGQGWWSGGKHHGGDGHGPHGHGPAPPAAGGGDAQGPGNTPAAQGGGDG